VYKFLIPFSNDFLLIKFLAWLYSMINIVSAGNYLLVTFFTSMKPRVVDKIIVNILKTLKDI